MLVDYGPHFEGWVNHTVAGLVGVVADQGLAVDSVSRTVYVTLLQKESSRGGDEVFHHLIFEDEEADRVLTLNVRSGDRLLVSLDRLAPKAYLVSEGDALRLVPYVESRARAALVLQRAGAPEPFEDFIDQRSFPGRGNKNRQAYRRDKARECEKAKKARAEAGEDDGD